MFTEFDSNKIKIYLNEKMSRQSVSRVCLSPRSPFWSWTKSKQQDYLDHYFKKNKYPEPIHTKKIESSIQKIIHQLIDNYNLVQIHINQKNSYIEYHFRANEPRLPIVLVKTQQLMEQLIKMNQTQIAAFYCQTSIQLLNQLYDYVQKYNHANVYMWFDVASIQTLLLWFNDVYSNLN